jgi:hypothetical protein
MSSSSNDKQRRKKTKKEQAEENELMGLLQGLNLGLTRPKQKSESPKDTKMKESPKRKGRKLASVSESGIPVERAPPKKYSSRAKKQPERYVPDTVPVRKTKGKEVASVLQEQDELTVPTREVQNFEKGGPSKKPPKPPITEREADKIVDDMLAIPYKPIPQDIKFQQLNKTSEELLRRQQELIDELENELENARIEKQRILDAVEKVKNQIENGKKAMDEDEGQMGGKRRGKGRRRGGVCAPAYMPTSRTLSA